MASSSSSSLSVSGDLVEMKPALEDEEVKEYILGPDFKIDPCLLPPFKPCSSQQHEKISLFKYLEENSKYYGDGRVVITPSSLSIIINLIPPPPLSSTLLCSVAPQDAIMDQNGGDENMNTESRSTGDDQKQQQHLHQNKREGQDNMTDVETSTKKMRLSTDLLEEKSTRLSIIDYATALHDHKYKAFGDLHFNLYEAADLLKCIPNVHPVDQRSELDKEIGMFCRDWINNQDPSIQYLDMYLYPTSDKDMEKVYESPVYIQVQNLVKTFDKNTVAQLKHFIDTMPMTDEVFKYDINWEVVDKCELHDRMRPWISNIAKNTIDEEADFIVSDILESMKDHASAVSIHKQIVSRGLVNEADREKLFIKIWGMLFAEIKKLEEGTSLEIFNDISKSKEELLLLEINWAIFDQHELHEKMRPLISKEVVKLLKKEKDSVVEQVVSVIKNRNCPPKMLELLQPSLDDYAEMVVRILWRTLLILVKIFDTAGFAAFAKSISSVNPNIELSKANGKNCMPFDDNLHHQDPVCNSEESNDAVEVVARRNRCYSYPLFWRQKKMLDFDMLCEINRLGNAVPRNLEKLYSYAVDWAMSDKIELHNRLRPWIFHEIVEFVSQEEAAPVVDSIVSRIKDHATVKDVLELVKPTLGDRSAYFVVHLWTQLIYSIQAAGASGPDRFMAIESERSATVGVKFSQYGDRYCRNRHFMMVAFDFENLCKLKQISESMPKTKGDLFSYEINWDVYEKYELVKNLRQGVWIETLELIRQKKQAMLVDEQIMWNIFDYHVSASRREFTAREETIQVFEEIMSRLHKYRSCPSKMVEYLEPILGSGSEKFVMKMWYALICGIKFAEARVEKKLKRGWGSILLLPLEGDDEDLLQD